MIKVLHNPKCSKSRECLLWLEETEKPYEIVPYLDKPLSRKALASLVKKLKVAPIEVVRTDEPVWKENFAGKSLSDEQVLDALAANPILLQRPIVVNGRKAAVARPVENALRIL
jgi:arsenate reductase